MSPCLSYEVVPVKEGNEVALTSSYIVSAGIQIIDSLNLLMDVLLIQEGLLDLVQVTEEVAE